MHAAEEARRPAAMPVAVQDGDPWAALGAADTAEQLCRAWLFLLCRRIGQARAGMLLMREPDGSFAPAAMAPAPFDAAYLAPVAQRALDTAGSARLPQPDGSLHLAYPVATREGLQGAVVLDLAPCDELSLSRHLRELHWGAGWLIDLFNRRSLGEHERRAADAAFLLDLSAAVLAEPEADRALLAFVNRLAQHFGCHQVLLGCERGRSMRVRAISHAAWFDERANVLQLAVQAMNETYDQRARSVLPPAPEGPLRITAALQAYAQESRSAAVCALPLEHGNELAGVCLLQRDVPFTPAELRLLDTLALTLGPAVDLKMGADESLPAHAARSARAWAGRVVDGSRPGLKLSLAAAALVLALLAFVKVDYRVAAEAVVEGAVQRSIVAPFDGYLSEAPARAGDVVRRGQVLATLDERDLRLERDRWQAELDIAAKREREALALGERAQLREASAQANQARAQLNLVSEKLARVQVVAPFDGIVVRGDLSQQLGSPLEIGKLLFELAPLDAWRVIVKVDERDIAYVQNGRSGELVLTSLPGQSWQLKVSKITPVSVPEEGRNHFRVEAELDRAGAAVRPGMEGVAKIESEPRSLLWIATHRFTDWLRLAWWRLMP